MSTVVLTERPATDPVGEDLSETMPSDSSVSEIISNLLSVIKKAVGDLRNGENPEFVKIVDYKMQEDPCSFEMDTNFFVKLQVAEKEFVHVKIAQDPNRKLILCKLAKKEAGDEIVKDF